MLYVVLGARAVMELANGVTVPSLVYEPEEVVGLGEVLQQTPSAVTGDPPLDVTLPPPLAVIDVIFEIAVVVTVGKAAEVVNVKELP